MMTAEEFLEEWFDEGTMVRVKTSGSTGAPKEMWVEKERMRASARMTCEFLGLRRGDCALLCMPVDYIAGKMMVVRAVERGMRLFSVVPSGHPLSDESLGKGSWIVGEDGGKGFDFVAMVPLQVYNTLQVEEERERLRSVRHLLIGGGAIDERMERALRDFPCEVWSSYGMTETLSHIAMRKISGSGASLWYKTLPGVSINTTEEGCLVIDAPAICSEKLTTNDIVEMKNDMFRVLGRRDNVICSGGIKIQAEEVEAVLRPFIECDFAISKRKNERFGEVVVLVGEDEDMVRMRGTCEKVLPKKWQPKEYVAVRKIPKTETGKVARKVLEEMIK